MKKSYILAVCAAMACTVLAGCGPAEENTNVENPVVTTSAETEETTAAETEAETTAAETSETTAAETTDVTTEASESETAAETTTEEKKDEEKKEETTQADTSGDEKPSDNETPSGNFSESDLTFTFNGNSVTVGQDLSAFKAALAPSSEDKAQSCLGNGEDCICEYDHFTINGYIENDQCTATGITLKDSEVSTSKGIKIGSSKDDVINAYGTDYTERGSEIVYTSGKSTLSFRIEDGEVKSISYDFSLL